MERVKVLQEVQRTINEWLRFAEAKNGALLTVDTAILAALLTKWSSVPEGHLLIILIFSGSLIYASAVICLFSFAPQVMMHSVIRRKKRSPNSDDNPLFFGHAVKYGEDVWLSRVMGIDASAPIERYTAQQVIAVSKIAADKYNYFDVAILLTTAAFIVPPTIIAGRLVLTALAR